MKRTEKKTTTTGRDRPIAEVDAYLAGIPAPARAALEKIRAAIKAAAPEAVEGISYGVPGFKHHGYLAGFAAFKDHCSFFPGSTLDGFKDDLKDFKTTKGSVHFMPERPLPAALVKKIVRARVKENRSR